METQIIIPSIVVEGHNQTKMDQQFSPSTALWMGAFRAPASCFSSYYSVWIPWLLRDLNVLWLQLFGWRLRRAAPHEGGQWALRGSKGRNKHAASGTLVSRAALKQPD